MGKGFLNVAINGIGPVKLLFGKSGEKINSVLSVISSPIACNSKLRPTY